VARAHPTPRFQRDDFDSCLCQRKRSHATSGSRTDDHGVWLFKTDGHNPYSPPRRGGVAAPLKECREATDAAQTGWSDRRNVSPNRPPRRFAPPLLCEEGDALHPCVTRKYENPAHVSFRVSRV